MHKDPQTRPATHTYIHPGDSRKKDRTFEEERNGENKEVNEGGEREGWGDRWGVAGGR